MSVVINGTTGITNDGGYTGDGVVFADTTPANTLVTTTGGNVGVGTSTPLAKLVVSNAGAQGIEFGYSAGLTANFMQSINRPGGADVDMAYYLAGTGVHRFYTNATERARIDSGGILLVGRTSAYSDGSMGTPVIQAGGVNGVRTGAALIQDSTAATGAIGFANPNGYCGGISTSGTSTTYATSSDYRLKENIAPMTGALAKVAALKPVTYKWKSTGEADEGFIAHELQEVCPSAVTGEKDAVDAEGNPQYQGIDTSFLVATLTAAIQEQQAIITAQAAQIQQLREKVLEVEEGTSNMLVENTNNLYETITALTARVAALEGTQP